MKVLLVDHEDSFVHNIAQALATSGAHVTCLRATEPERAAQRTDPDAVVLSPGPGRPGARRLTGLARTLLRRWDTERPFLGVCLGHQVVAEHYGGTVGRAETPVHGEVRLVAHDGAGLFRGIASPTPVARYHSLVVTGIPPSLLVTARDEQGVVMGLRHRRRPVSTVQFHPESYLTRDGPQMFENFLEGARR